MINTQDFLNRVAYPLPGDNARRKITPLQDQITVASGTTLYNPFTTATGNIFARNKKFPLSGTEIFAITNISCYLKTVITSTTLYAGLLTLLQQSYLEIVVDSRVQLKVPLLEVMSYDLVPQIGATTIIGLQTKFVNRSKDLVYPIVLNSSSNVQVNVVLATATATAFDASLINISLNGVMSDKLDSYFVNMVGNSQFQELAWTLWESNLISTVNQNTFNLFATPTLAQNLFSGVVPLSSTERLEIQAIEFFFGGNAGATDTPQLVKANRINNVLSIVIDNVEYYKGDIEGALSIAGAQTGAFGDDGAPVDTPITLLDVYYENKVLDIPLIIPANSNVVVSLTQPGSSLNSNQYFTALFKGKKVRQVV
jgi:hypothetical protein